MKRDSSGKAQYFIARFPPSIVDRLHTGDLVEYMVICNSMGKQVPSAEEAKDFTSSFLIAHADRKGIQSLEPKAGAMQGRHGHFQSITKEFIIHGKIALVNGSPLSGVTVKAYNKTLRGEQYLEESVTDKNGYYKMIIQTSNNQNQNDSNNGNIKYRCAYLIVRVFSDRLQHIGESELIENDSQEIEVNITVSEPEKPLLDEYGLLLSRLTPILEGQPLSELTDENVTFLSRCTDIDKEIIELLRQTARLSRQTPIPSEAFYGIARMKLPIELNKLAGLSFNNVKDSLHSAVDQKIVSKELLVNINETVKELKRYGKLTHRLVVQLLNEKNNVPLSNLMVQIFDLAGDEELEQDLGSFKTNDQGIFELKYGSRPQTSPSALGQKFALEIKDSNLKEISRTEIVVKTENEQSIMEVKVTVPIAFKDSPTLPQFLTLLQK